jgi:hypothetical protein
MQLSSSSYCQTKKKSKAFLIERDALTGPTVSVETTDYIKKVVLSELESSDKQQNKAPVSNETNSLTTSEEHQNPIMDCQFNLRRRTNLK